MLAEAWQLGSSQSLWPRACNPESCDPESLARTFGPELARTFGPDLARAFGGVDCDASWTGSEVPTSAGWHGGGAPRARSAGPCWLRREGPTRGTTRRGQ